jgi:hypothetical protein
MARRTIIALSIALPSAALVATVLAQGQAAPPQTPATKPATSAAGRAQDSALNSDQQVPYNPNQPQGSQLNSDQQVPIGQAGAAGNRSLPPNAGFNNPGGIVDNSTLTQQAIDGVHYHYHYYGPGAFVSGGGTPGYATTTYENPATAATPSNPFLTPNYGPGNPAPMNTLEGANSDNYNSRVGGGAGGAAAAGGVAGQAWGYGGGIGHWNPFAYGGQGYIEGFND